MKAKKSQALQIYQAIDHWVAESLISVEEGDKLKCSIEITRFDYKRLAKFSFWFAICCFVISAGAFMLSPIFAAFIAFFQALFTVLDPKLAAGLALSSIAGGFYYWGLRRRRTCPQTAYRNEALFFLGVLSTAGAIGSFASLFPHVENFSPILLIAALIYGALGLFFPSTLVWVFSLCSIASWYGCETGYASDWGTYFFGMNYPARFIPFSLALIALAFTFKSAKYSKRFFDFHKPTYVFGLLNLFMALWILSIWGTELGGGSGLVWSLVFGVAALFCIYCGLKFDDGPARGFGVTFFLINLHTKYFEFFWSQTDKAIFFLILGLSFWAIGSQAEKLWLFVSKNTLGEESATQEEKAA